MEPERIALSQRERDRLKVLHEVQRLPRLTIHFYGRIPARISKPPMMIHESVVPTVSSPIRALCPEFQR
jgi:hypothetical protein